MLKLIIADDERIIRETISTIIDWEKYDIEVIGLCKNGIETYDMILDESPDIVLTDIKMPGMDGIELIKKISQTDLNVQFIILSGYGEFEYAKEAMRNGVRHYLLKPCNENQIIECIEQCKKNCYQQKLNRQLAEDHFTALNSMSHNAIFGIINECVCQKRTFEEIRSSYESYIDFSFTAYRLYYIYFLQFRYLEAFLQDLMDLCTRYYQGVTIHGIYVNNTLLLFFKNFSASYPALDDFIQKKSRPDSKVKLETESELFSSLEGLLNVLLKKICRYDMIYYINNFHLIYTCNYNTSLQELDKLYTLIVEKKEKFTEMLSEFLDNIHDLNFLKQIASTLLLRLALRSTQMSSIQLSEWIMQIEQSNEIEDLKKTVMEKILEISCPSPEQPTVSVMTRQIFDYVSQNLQNPNLTLKYIAEHHLYMNVDYVSKKFLKDTGVKFSAYLTDVRIRRAKELLNKEEPDKIQNIAEEVGLGNNPQYFTQLFKRKTGITPSTYIEQLHKKI